MMKNTLVLSLAFAALSAEQAASLSVSGPSRREKQSVDATNLVASTPTAISTRRQALLSTTGIATAVLTGLGGANADTGAEVRGTSVTPFNGLIFNYRGSEVAPTVDALNEPSISYGDFVAKLKAGEVEFVEFMAPDGDKAYATIKGSSDKPIRIGEGYPIEQHDGWSSPAFAVRTVKNAGVPYKFTVPALSSYNRST